jgi:hypothetical protein
MRFGLKHLFQPWLGLEEYRAGHPLAGVGLAVRGHPDDADLRRPGRDPGRADRGRPSGRRDRLAQFWGIKLPLILPTVGIVSILTFVGNFNAFDLIYTTQRALAGPDFATDILGTFFYRTFFGVQLQAGDPTMGATIAGRDVPDHPGGVSSTCSATRRGCRGSSCEGPIGGSRPGPGPGHWAQVIGAHAVCWPTPLIALFPIVWS